MQVQKEKRIREYLDYYGESPKAVQIPSINEFVRQKIYEVYGEFFNTKLHVQTKKYQTLEQFIKNADVWCKIQLLYELDVVSFLVVSDVYKRPTHSQINSIENLINLQEEKINVEGITKMGVLFCSSYDINRFLPYISAAQNMVSNRLMKHAADIGYKFKRKFLVDFDEVEHKDLQSFSSYCLSVLEANVLDRKSTRLNSSHT